jgi:hypothetical protein
MFTRTGGAEKIGEWELPIWTLRWIEEKANVARTPDGKKIGARRQSGRTSDRIEEKASAARRWRGFLGEEDLATPPGKWYAGCRWDSGIQQDIKETDPAADGLRQLDES